MLAGRASFALDHRYGCNAVLNGNRAMCRAVSDPRYNQSPYSRTVVMGE
jgi:hypothetical protein